MINIKLIILAIKLDKKNKQKMVAMQDHRAKQ